MTTKTGAELDQEAVVRVRDVLHAAGECRAYDTADDVRRVLRERDELRAEVERLRASLEQIAGIDTIDPEFYRRIAINCLADELERETNPSTPTDYIQ